MKDPKGSLKSLFGKAVDSAKELAAQAAAKVREAANELVNKAKERLKEQTVQMKSMAAMALRKEALNPANLKKYLTEKIKQGRATLEDIAKSGLSLADQARARVLLETQQLKEKAQKAANEALEKANQLKEK